MIMYKYFVRNELVRYIKNMYILYEKWFCEIYEKYERYGNKR